MSDPCPHVEDIFTTKTKVGTMEDLLVSLADDVRCIREKMWTTKGFITGVVISGSIVGGIISLAINLVPVFLKHGGG